MTNEIQPGQLFYAKLRKTLMSMTFGGREAAGKVFGPFVCTELKRNGPVRVVHSKGRLFNVKQFECHAAETKKV